MKWRIVYLQNSTRRYSGSSSIWRWLYFGVYGYRVERCGHILIIPKAHTTNILDCNEKLLSKVTLTTKKVSNHLVENCGYHGVDLMCANGEAAGQSLPHFHIHIIPRHEQDKLGAKGEWPKFPGAKEDIMEVYQKVRIR